MADRFKAFRGRDAALLIAGVSVIGLILWLTFVAVFG